MSALGQKQTLSGISAISALPPKADIGQHGGNVRFVPKAEMTEHIPATSITSSATSALAS
jgi:hypothetical protein